MTEKPYQYRIVEHAGIGFEPQMLYRVPMTGKDVWHPLNEAGFWLQDSYSYGDASAHLVFDRREDAERVLTRAKAINEEHIQAVTGMSGA